MKKLLIGGATIAVAASIAAGCSKTSHEALVPVPKPVAPASAPPSTPAPTTTPKPSLASQYSGAMAGLLASPAWQTVAAQVAPENSYMTSFQGNPPTVSDAQLATVTAEFHNVSAVLNNDAQADESLSNLDAVDAVQSVAIDLTEFSTTLSTGTNIPDTINTLHKDDVQARTLLSLPLTGPGAVPQVPEVQP